MAKKAKSTAGKNPALKRFRRRLRSKQKRRVRFRRLSASKTVSTSVKISKKKTLVKRGRQYVDIEVPEELSLFRGYEDAVEFLQRLRETALSQRKAVRLIFDKSKFIGPAALTCLLAELYRCTRIEPRAARLEGTYPADKKIEQMLQSTGFFKMLGVRDRNPNMPPKYPMEYIPFNTGTQAIGEAAEALETGIFGNVTAINPEASSKLYRALTEAMTNVVQHAYPSTIPRHLAKLKNRWWLLGTVNRRKKDFTAILFDQGVGIPKTIPNNYNMDTIRATLSLLRVVEPNDGELIQAAMLLGKSKTKEAHRGKGLQDLKGLIDQCGEGSLRIMSRKGDYAYNVRTGEVVTNHIYSLGGTLIQWQVPLSAITNLHDLDQQ